MQTYKLYLESGPKKKKTISTLEANVDSAKGAPPHART